VVTVRQQSFRVTVVLDPSASDDAVGRLLDGAGASCVVQPIDGKCVPARISVAAAPSPEPAAQATLHVRLLDGEAEASFGVGQPFVVWADAMVDDMAIRGERLVGDGVIVSQEPAAGPSGADPEGLGPTSGQPYHRTARKPEITAGTSRVGG
jgi:hypothetical protein